MWVTSPIVNCFLDEIPCLSNMDIKSHGVKIDTQLKKYVSNPKKGKPKKAQSRGSI